MSARWIDWKKRKRIKAESENRAEQIESEINMCSCYRVDTYIKWNMENQMKVGQLSITLRSLALSFARSLFLSSRV